MSGVPTTKRITTAASSASTPPSPPGDTSGTASAGSPGRTHPRPPRPAEYGPRPTTTAAPSRCAFPTSPAPRLSSLHGCVSARDRPSPCPPHTPRTRRCLAETPGRADIRGLTAAATGERNNPSRTSAAASPGSPAGTTGTAAARAAPAEAPRAPLCPHRPVCVPVLSPFQLRPFAVSPLQRSRPTAASHRSWCSV